MAFIIIALFFFAVATCTHKFPGKTVGVMADIEIANPLNGALDKGQFQGQLDDAQFAEFQAILENMSGDLQATVFAFLQSMDQSEWSDITESLSTMRPEDVDNLVLFLETVDNEHWTLLFDAMGHLDVKNTHHLFDLLNAVDDEHWSELFNALGYLQPADWNTMLGFLDALQPNDWEPFLIAMGEPMDDDSHWSRFISYLTLADWEGLDSMLLFGWPCWWPC